MTAPDVVIYVRHSADCKHAADESYRRCNCKKWLRWTANGKRFREPAKTRSWAEAEEARRRVGGTPEPVAEARRLDAAIEVFLADKRVQGVSEGVVSKYDRELSRMLVYFRERRVDTVAGVSRELLTGYCQTWTRYPSTITRAKVRERLRSFLRYCYEAQWLDRIPVVPKIRVDEPETQPLTPEEYDRLLDAVYVAVDSQRDGPALQVKVKTFLETMRWTGFAILDTMTLRRDALTNEGGRYRVTTKRKKTGTPVSVPVPPAVAEALQSLPAHGSYFFWSGGGKPQSATSNWGQRYIAPVFKAAGITSEGNMLSHRLRDTFAVRLLEKGVPMEEVSRLLGHTSIRTTEKHYAKWSQGRQARVDDLVSGTW